MVSRADNEQRRRVRSNYVAALRAVFPIYAIDEEIALRAGAIDGELALRGLRIGLADVLIAATALQRGDGVATFNLNTSRPCRALPWWNCKAKL